MILINFSTVLKKSLKKYLSSRLAAVYSLQFWSNNIILTTLF